MSGAPNPTPRYKVSRKQSACPCGVCGRDIAVNVGGTYRAHGPEDDRCVGAGLKVRAVVYPRRVGAETTVYGACGVCGVSEREITNAKAFMREHNHGRPRVFSESGGYVVSWFRYRSYQWRRRYFDTRDLAMEFALNIKEYTR